MSNKDKFILITFLITFVIYNIIGYIFDVDVLRFIIFHKNGFGVSFVTVITPLITSYLIYNILKYLNLNIQH